MKNAYAKEQAELRRQLLNYGALVGQQFNAFDLLNARYIKPSLVTIISSEWTISRVLDWDEAIGSRIAERSKGCVLNITGSKNCRLK